MALPEHPAPPFRPHGRIECRRSGRVIRTQAQGPFNAESVRGYGQMLASLTAELPDGCPFVVIATMSGSILATPDAWEALEAGVRRRQGGAHRQLGSAWVVAGDVEGRSLFVPRARSLYESMGIRFGAFDQAAAAETWADTLLEDPASR
ncbi:hypothetical protein GCM10028794_22530 [Silanimonas algicola]